MMSQTHHHQASDQADHPRQPIGNQRKRKFRVPKLRPRCLTGSIEEL
jgi:hypothetical protein